MTLSEKMKVAECVSNKPTKNYSLTKIFMFCIKTLLKHTLSYLSSPLRKPIKEIACKESLTHPSLISTEKIIYINLPKDI